MTRTDSTDLRRWSDEVARDPGSPFFLPLAEQYRQQGRREAAMRVCLRGLEHEPSHVGAHELLAKLYLELGERQKAADEWGFVLRLDEHNFAALRGLGFTFLERGDLAAAERHLESARQLRPNDRTVLAALDVLEERRSRAGGDGTRRIVATPADPGALFDELKDELHFGGAVLVDRQGLIVGGRLDSADDARAERLAAGLGVVLEEATRAATHLGLGAWRSLLLETDVASLEIGPVDGAHAMVTVARVGAPAGWMVRMSRRALDIARRFLGGGGA
ncbi:MAG: roadblock/LC7 domain-containing protein [Longimicrobiales bacterium]